MPTRNPDTQLTAEDRAIFLSFADLTTGAHMHVDDIVDAYAMNWFTDDSDNRTRFIEAEALDTIEDILDVAGITSLFTQI